MPAKGEIVSKIHIALDRWARDWLAKHPDKRPADLARRIEEPNRFVHDLLHGKINTLMSLEKCVKAEGGDYLAFSRYAETKEGLKVLKNFQRRQKMQPYILDQLDETDFLISEEIREQGDLRRIVEAVREIRRK